MILRHWLVVAVAACLFSGQPLWAQEAGDGADMVIRRLEQAAANVSKVESMRGEARVNYRSRWGEAGEDVIGEAGVRFALEGEQFRTDIFPGSVSGGDFTHRLFTKHALAEGVEYSALRPPDEESEQVTVRQAGEDYDLWEWQGAFDPRRLAQPFTFSLEALARSVRRGGAASILGVEDDGRLYSVKVNVFPEEPDTYAEVVLDAEQGWQVVLDRYVEQGRLLVEIERDYEHLGGVWVLDKLRMREWDGGKADGEVRERVEIVMGDVAVNVAIPDETFDLRGFELSPETKIRDHIAGLTYTLEPDTDIRGAVDQILTRVDELKHTAEAATGREPEVAEPDAPEAAAVEEIDEPRSSGSTGAVVGIVLVIGGVVVMAFRRRAKTDSRPKRSS